MTNVPRYEWVAGEKPCKNHYHLMVNGKETNLRYFENEYKEPPRFQIDTDAPLEYTHEAVRMTLIKNRLLSPLSETPHRLFAEYDDDLRLILADMQNPASDQPVIPAGYEALAKGIVLQEGDLYHNRGGWFPTVPESHPTVLGVTYIRPIAKKPPVCDKCSTELYKAERSCVRAAVCPNCCITKGHEGDFDWSMPAPKKPPVCPDCGGNITKINGDGELAQCKNEECENSILYSCYAFDWPAPIPTPDLTKPVTVETNWRVVVMPFDTKVDSKKLADEVFKNVSEVYTGRCDIWTESNKSEACPSCAAPWVACEGGLNNCCDKNKEAYAAKVEAEQRNRQIQVLANEINGLSAMVVNPTLRDKLVRQIVSGEVTL